MQMETKKNVLHVHEFPRLSTKEDLVVRGISRTGDQQGILSGYRVKGQETVAIKRETFYMSVSLFLLL